MGLMSVLRIQDQSKDQKRYGNGKVSVILSEMQEGISGQYQRIRTGSDNGKERR